MNPLDSLEHIEPSTHAGSIAAVGAAASRVWAPGAGEVTLIRDGFKHPMVCGDNGWWTAAEALPHGAIYGYVIDGDGPFPDPRSPFQPFGVHGLSQHVDHCGFSWTDHRWQAPPLAAGVIYELHIGTFTEAGTLAGAIARLPYLAELGVTHVEVMPVAEFSGDRGWGYDGVHLFAPHHAYGNPD